MRRSASRLTSRRRASADTPGAFSQILCDLLSPADDNVKVGLRETTHSTSPLLRSKTLVAQDAHTRPSSPVQRQHQARAASAHPLVDGQEVTSTRP